MALSRKQAESLFLLLDGTLTASGGILKVNSSKLPTGETFGAQLGAQIVTMGDKSQNNAPTYIEIFKGNGSGGVNTVRGRTGFMGTTEFNMAVNFKYPAGIHDYDDNTQNAIWSYMGQTNGWGLQFVPANNPYAAGVVGNDIFTKWGCVPAKIELYNQPATGKGIDGFSKFTTARIELANSTDTSTVANSKATFENVNSVIETRIGASALMQFSALGGLVLNQQGATITLDRSGNTGANSCYIVSKSGGTFLSVVGHQRSDNTGVFASGVTANSYCINAQANDVYIGNTAGPAIAILSSGATKIQASTIGLYTATPVAQATTSVASATVGGTGGTSITTNSTFDGYTIAQMAKALRNLGAIA